MRLRRLQLSLTNLLGLVALAAGVFWFLWHGYPAWQRSRAVNSLERAVRTRSGIGEALERVAALDAGEAAASVLASFLSHPDSEVRTEAAKALHALGPKAKPATAALIEGMGDSEGEVRQVSSNALARIGVCCVPDLIAALKDDRPDVRGWAAEALGDIGPAASEAIPALVAVATDRTEAESVRRDAVRNLVYIDRDNERVVETVRDALRSGSLVTPYGISLALASGTDDRALRLIRRLLAHDDGHVREAAVHALGYLARAQGKPIPPELSQALHDPAAEVRSAAACHLGMCPEKAAKSVPTLRELLHDDDSRVRTWAARAIWQITQQADESLPILIEAVRDGHNCARGGAAQTFSEMGADAAVVVPVMVEALQVRDVHAEGDKRWHIAFALGEFGSDAASAAPILVEILRDKNAAGRSMIARALGQIGSSDEVAVPALIESLQDRDPDLRGQAAEALGKFGSAGQVALPALRAAIGDEWSYVRGAARAAIANIMAASDDSQTSD